LGLIGIYKKNAKLFAAYLFILFLLIICQFGVGGGAYTWRNQIPGEIQAAWRSLSDRDRNSIQQQLLCCGWWNNTDAEGSNCNSTATGLATTGMVTTGMATTGVTNMKRQAMPTDYYLTTGMMLPNASDAPCGPYIILVSQTALNYVGAVEVAFALIQMVGLFTGLALAIWILVQAGKQRFRMGEEELGSKFAKQDYTGGGNDDDDDGMSDPPHSGDGKRKIVVNFGGN